MKFEYYEVNAVTTGPEDYNQVLFYGVKFKDNNDLTAPNRLLIKTGAAKFNGGSFVELAYFEDPDDRAKFITWLLLQQ